MSDKTLTLEMTTQELKKLIRDEFQGAMEDVPTTADVDRMIDNRLSREIVQWGAEVDSKIDKATDGMITPLADEMRKLTHEIALLVQQVRAMNRDVRDVKDEQKRQDKEQDEIKRELGKLESHAVEQSAKIDSQERAIFGDPDRPGTKSLFDHITDTDRKRGAETQAELNKLDRKLDAANTGNLAIKAEVSTIAEAVKQNTQWREARQKVERFVVQSIPKAAGRLKEAFDYRYVKWSALAALISLLAKLFEGLS